jgi:nucleoid-associated protein YgaU
MYRVGEKDNLSTIAETHLGRSTRWTEIVALNKQTLKNFDRLKLGTVLRLPDDASEAATK